MIPFLSVGQYAGSRVQIRSSARTMLPPSTAAISSSDILLFEAWRVHGERVTATPDHYGPETLRLLRSGAVVGAADYGAALAARERLPPAAARYVESALAVEYRPPAVG
jgi:hypothetical protein